jgi:hypothetical protein
LLLHVKVHPEREEREKNKIYGQCVRREEGQNEEGAEWE